MVSFFSRQNFCSCVYVCVCACASAYVRERSTILKTEVPIPAEKDFTKFGSKKKIAKNLGLKKCKLALACSISLSRMSVFYIV